MQNGKHINHCFDFSCTGVKKGKKQSAGTKCGCWTAVTPSRGWMHVGEVDADVDASQILPVMHTECMYNVIIIIVVGCCCLVAAARGQPAARRHPIIFPFAVCLFVCLCCGHTTPLPLLRSVRTTIHPFFLSLGKKSVRTWPHLKQHRGDVATPQPATHNNHALHLHRRSRHSSLLCHTDVLNEDSSCVAQEGKKTGPNPTKGREKGCKARLSRVLYL